MKRVQQHFSYIKVKDIRKYMFEVFTDELFSQLDIDEFVKNEIESKAIVVIDEIDKLVRSVSITTIYNIFGRVIPLPRPRPQTRVSSTTSCPSWTAPPSLLILVSD